MKKNTYKLNIILGIIGIAGSILFCISLTLSLWVEAAFHSNSRMSDAYLMLTAISLAFGILNIVHCKWKWCSHTALIPCTASLILCVLNYNVAFLPMSSCVIITGIETYLAFRSQTADPDSNEKSPYRFLLIIPIVLLVDVPSMCIAQLTENSSHIILPLHVLLPSLAAIAAAVILTVREVRQRKNSTDAETSDEPQDND